MLRIYKKAPYQTGPYIYPEKQVIELFL